MESAMRRFIKNALFTGNVRAGMAASLAVRPIAAADTKDDQSVLQADQTRRFSPLQLRCQNRKATIAAKAAARKR
jgi:hypothetical protein